MEPDLVTFKFDGSIKIHLNVAQATEYLVLHQADLKINSAVLTSGTGESETTSSAKILTNEELEYLYLKFSSSLEPGDVRHLRELCVCVCHSPDLRPARVVRARNELYGHTQR